MQINRKQLDILSECLGLLTNNKPYKNFILTSKIRPYDDDFKDLVRKGLLSDGAHVGNKLFSATLKGAKAIGLSEKEFTNIHRFY